MSQQKLDAMGQLWLGVAQELNTPTQYVRDNVAFLQRNVEKLLKLIETQTAVVESARIGNVSPLLLEATDNARRGIKLDYLARQIPRALEQSLQGLGEISAVVKAMKEFSQPSGDAKQPFDLNDLIESTTIVSRNEWQYVAELQLDFDWSLPPVPLRRSEFGQVLLTLIVNAARAVSNSLPPNWSEKGKIVIATKGLAESAEVRVSDSGTGSTVIVSLPLAAA